MNQENPQNFQLTTDFATLKNDAKTTISLVLPSSTIVGAGSVARFTSTVAVGVPGSSIRARISSTSIGNTWFPLAALSRFVPTGSSIPGDPSYLLVIIVNRVSPTEIALTALIPNPYGSAATITGLAQTITAVVSTFLPPLP